MKTRNVTVEAGFLFGAFAVALAACSDASAPPRGTGGATSTTGGSGNTAGNSSSNGGSTVIAGAGGSIVGNGGSSPIAGAGGSSTAGSGGSSTAGASSGGSGGSPAMSCGSLQPATGDVKCCVAAGTATDLAIDDLEDGDNVILPVGNRQGYWYLYSDASATQLPSKTGTFPPKSGGGHPCSLLPLPTTCAGTASGTLFSAETSGSLMPASATVPTYAGLGFDFNNHFKKSCAYGASAYKGISFWAKGSPIKAAVKIPATTSTSTTDAGSCAAKCEDHYSQLIVPPPDGSWKQFTITFADSVNFAQAGWGTPATFDASSLLGVQFQIDGLATATAAAPFDFSVDDVAFVP